MRLEVVCVDYSLYVGVDMYKQTASILRHFTKTRGHLQIFLLDYYQTT